MEIAYFTLISIKPGGNPRVRGSYARMPLYRLHIHNSFGFAADEEGVDLPSLDAARAEALGGIRSIISEEAKQGKIDLTGRIEIVDDGGNDLLTVSFRDAFELKI